VKLRCHLREIRGTRTLREIAELSGVPASELSKIENGIQVPKDESIAALVRAYQAEPVDWYEPMTLLALESDDAMIVGVRARLRTTLLPLA
jgi:transcriptional regulator with XRE-family HTH domain